MPTWTGLKWRARRLIDSQRVARDTFPADLAELGFRPAYDQVAPYTMTTPERLFVLQEACAHLAKAGIPGAFVECGVWRGGSSMMAALAFMRAGDLRDLYLFDTFEGMPAPGDSDRRITGGEHAAELMQRFDDAGELIRAEAGLEEVQENLLRTGYHSDRLHYVKGMVEDTIPSQAPREIALLRLDTDWYESTKHELEHLYPRLQVGGVLILDDYGYWQGARRAVDEYFADRPILLNRIDRHARIAIKALS